MTYLIIHHKGQLSTSVCEQQFSCPALVPEVYLLPPPSVSASSHVGAAGGNSGYHRSHLKTYEYFLEKKERPLVEDMANIPSLPIPRSFSEGRILSHFTQKKNKTVGKPSEPARNGMCLALLLLFKIVFCNQ